MANILLRTLSTGLSDGATTNGAPLTNIQVDTNFNNLNAAKFEKAGGTLLGTLTLAPGTLSNPPLIFQDGVLMSSPSAGSIEFDGEKLYITNADVERKEIVTTDDIQTLTNKTINGSLNTITNIPNSALQNAQFGVVAGTGLSGGGTANLGQTVTLNNAGVTGITGTANQVVASASTGSVTLSLPQSIATTSNVQFGAVGVGTSPVANEIRATGEITAFFTSDASLKENVTPIENALAKVSHIRGVSFDWSDAYIESRGGEDGFFVRKHDVGVIAQEVQAVLPEVVVTRENNTLAVNYEKIIPLLIQAINELNQKVSKCSCA